MKRIFYVILLLVSFSFNDVFASTKTFERTKENNYLVNEDVLLDNNLNNIMSTPAVDEKEKIYDFADLLTEEEEDNIYNELKQYIFLNNMDFVVVTTNSHSKINTKEYANDFYDYNNFGIGSTHDGLIFVLDMYKREFYISTTGSAIDMFTDYRINNILDYCFEDIKNGNYYDGITRVINRATYFSQVGVPNEYGEEPKLTGILKLKSLAWGHMFIGSAIVTGIVVLIMCLQYRNVRAATSSRHYLTDSQVNVTKDVFLNRNVSKTRRVQESSSGGSYRSSSSGRSVSRSSSGRSHGGGGRRF